MRKVIKSASNLSRREAFDDLIEELDMEVGYSDEDWIDVWNAYALSADQPKIYPMSEIDEILLRQEGWTLIQVINALSRYFDTNDEFFYIDDTDFIVSFTELSGGNSPFDINLLADTILEVNDGKGFPEIQEFLDNN